MNKNKYICLAGLLFPLSLMAQTASDKVLCDFETTDSYKSVGVYDTWANSPFRTKKLTGNAQVVKNHLTEVDPGVGRSSQQLIQNPRCAALTLRFEHLRCTR